MKNIKFIIQIVAIVLLFASCSEKWLDTTQQGVLSEETFYSDIENVKLGVNGAYASLNPQPGGLHNLDVMYIVFGSIASDDAEAGGEQGGNDFIDIQDADKGTTQPSEPKALSDNFWGYNYKSILRANAALDGIKKFRSSKSNLSEADKKLLDQYEGEMQFILAFTHFKLVQVYGGVPIVDHLLAPSEYKMKRNTIAECLHKVEEILTKACPKLPLRSAVPASELGRFTKGAAQSLLAKAYLFEASYAENYPGDARFTGCTNTYDKALAYADSVIASGEYELVGINGETFDTYWNSAGSPIYANKTPGYRYIFTVDGENTKESVFEIQSVNDGQPYMLTRGTYLTVYMGVRNYNSTTLGWGFNCPTEDLLSAYEVGDPRKQVSIGQTGDPIYMGAWGTINCMASPTNMIGRKFEASQEQYWTSKQADGNGPNDLYYIRYADVVLMAAEAAFKAGKNAPLSGLSPLQLVNMIRKRARNGAATGVPADLATVSFDDIAKERRLELAMEGHRFFDLVRWKKQDVLVGQPLQKWLGGVAQASPVSCQFTPGKNDFFPIPMVEVVNSGYNLEQYPGW